MSESERLLRALGCIQDYLARHGRSPSVRALAGCMGFSSPRSAAVLIDDLVAAGYLRKRQDGRIQLLRESGTGTARTVEVPIVGSAPCGTPLSAEENIEGVVRVDSRLAKRPHRYFIVRAQGTSMNRAGINDGDLVLVRSTRDARDGDRVVALVDGEVTIKSLRRGRDVVALEPRSSNPTHRPIFTATELEIQGVVVASLS